MQYNGNGSNGVVDAISDAVIENLGKTAESARGLPNEAFTSPDFLALERKHLFSRTWVFAGPASDVPNAGDVKPIDVAGRALFLARDQDGELRVFYNVCPHRGARLVTQSSEQTRVLTCPYHAWSFDLSGKLKGRPHFYGPEKHDRADNGSGDDACLFEVRSATWHDWVFVNLDGLAPAFEDYMGPPFARFQSWNFSSFKKAHYQPFEFHCNWKLAIENFCDNYHVFKVHPDLHDMQTVQDRFPMEPDGRHMFNHFIISGEGRGLTIDPDGPTLPEVPGLPAEFSKSSPYCSIFPNTTMAVFPTNLEFFMFEPLSVDKTIMHVWFYFAEEAAEVEEHRAAREKVYAEWTQLNAEDSGICRRLQQGRSCDDYDGGRFSPYWDAGTLHFHTQVATAIRGEGLYAR
jgi:choline monooxygenase